MIFNLSIGLVLDGGGGRGAYQIGVWKYFLEKRIKFDYISGTSAGALNSVLICQNNYKKAEKLWTQLKPEDIKEIDKKKLAKIVAELAKELLSLTILRKNAKTSVILKEIVRYLGYTIKSKDIYNCCKKPPSIFI